MKFDFSGGASTVKFDFSDRELYDVACALRGPDYPATWVKRVFSARIRFLARVDKEAAEVRANGLTDEEARKFINEVNKIMVDEQRSAAFSLFHYLAHVETAANILGDTDLAILANRTSIRLSNVNDPADVIFLAGGE